MPRFWLRYRLAPAIAISDDLTPAVSWTKVVDWVMPVPKPPGMMYINSARFVLPCHRRINNRNPIDEDTGPRMLNSLYRPVLIHGQLVSSSARQNPKVRSPLNNEAYEETANSVANNSWNQARAGSRD
jgi:hypothetical protein